MDAQARRERCEGVVGKLLSAPRRLGAPLSLINVKYSRMRHFKKNNSKFSRSRKNVSPGPAVVGLYVTVNALLGTRLYY